MTSWKGRINSEILRLTLFSFIKQPKVCNFKVILVLSTDEFPMKEVELPAELVTVIKLAPNAELMWTGANTKAYKKYFPVARAYPDVPIITVDDDSPAKNNFLTTLWELHTKDPDRVIYGYNHVLPDLTLNGCIDNVRYGVALYPPNSLYPLDETFGHEFFKDMDDEFMRLLHVLNGTRYRAVDAYSILHMQASNQDVAMGRIMSDQWGQISSMWNKLWKVSPELKKIWDKNKCIQNY
jgi:hypothetical protein